MFSNSIRIGILILLAITVGVNLGRRSNFPASTPFPILAFPEVASIQWADPALTVPTSIRVDPSGFLLVADVERDQIVRLSPEGRSVGTIGGLGQGPGELRSPYTTAIHPDGSFSVLDQVNQRIQVFTVKGAPIRSIAVGAAGMKGLAEFPDGSLFTSRNGSAYHSSTYYSILELGPDGKRRRSWEIESAVVDLCRERDRRLLVLTVEGLLLMNRNGGLVKRLLNPAVNPHPPSRSAWSKKPLRPFTVPDHFAPKAMVQAPDGKVYVSGGDYVLVYDQNYNPEGVIPPSSLIDGPISAVGVDLSNRLWAADEHGNMVRLDLNRRL